MPLDPIAGRAVQITEFTLDALELRRQTRAHNLANVNTPGFRAQKVDFETTLAAAVEAGDLSRLRPVSPEAANSPANEQGNTVDVGGEMVSMVADGLLQESMVKFFNFKTNQLRTALGRR